MLEPGCFMKTATNASPVVMQERNSEAVEGRYTEEYEQKNVPNTYRRCFLCRRSDAPITDLHRIHCFAWRCRDPLVGKLARCLNCRPSRSFRF